MSSHVTDFNARNKILTAKPSPKLRKAFSKFLRRHYELVYKFNVGLKSFATGPIGTRILWLLTLSFKEKILW